MKKKIVIASVLKPVDDVRSYWKLSQSMAKTNKYEVNIIGNTGKKELNASNIKFYPHSLNRRNWSKRLFLRPLILWRVLKIKPELFIISTHELLLIALIAKWTTGCKIIYDVQENYKLNLSLINPTILRNLAASLVRWKEDLSKHYVDQYWLAEACYMQQLSFTKEKALILENKAFDYAIEKRNHSPIQLLFSGTVSEYSGIKRALILHKEILKLEVKATLHIIGQVHDKRLANWLKEAQEGDPSIELTISENPIPYPLILKAISQANIGVIGYTPNAVNKEKTPTKLYEYSRYHLPYIVETNTKWSELGAKLGGAIPVDFASLDCQNILEIYKKSESNFPSKYPEESKWEYESLRLISSLNTLIN